MKFDIELFKMYDSICMILISLMELKVGFAVPVGVNMMYCGKLIMFFYLKRVKVWSFGNFNVHCPICAVSTSLAQHTA